MSDFCVLGLTDERVFVGVPVVNVVNFEFFGVLVASGDFISRASVFCVLLVVISGKDWIGVVDVEMTVDVFSRPHCKNIT
jgi:hypothetical protein